MKDCIFCKIIQEKVPCHQIYADENNLAFLDAFPHAKGHTVVIPRKHTSNTFDLEDNLVASHSIAVKKTMLKIQKVLNPDGFNVGWNHNKAAGQAVNHLHVHIIPRWNGDGGGSMHSIIKNPGEVSIEKVSELFKDG